MHLAHFTQTFVFTQACEGEGGAEGLVGKAEEDPPGVRDHLLDGHGDLLDGHGDLLGGQDDLLDGHGDVVGGQDDLMFL